MVLVWRITDNSPNSPNFLPAKLSRYTVCGMYIYIHLYLYLYIYLFIDLSGSTVQSTIVDGVNLFTMPGMQCVVYVKSSQVLAATSFFAAYCHE